MTDMNNMLKGAPLRYAAWFLEAFSQTFPKVIMVDELFLKSGVCIKDFGGETHCCEHCVQERSDDLVEAFPDIGCSAYVWNILYVGEFHFEGRQVPCVVCALAWLSRKEFGRDPFGDPRC